MDACWGPFLETGAQQTLVVNSNIDPSCCGPFVNQNNTSPFFCLQGIWAWLSKEDVFVRKERACALKKGGVSGFQKLVLSFSGFLMLMELTKCDGFSFSTPNPTKGIDSPIWVNSSAIHPLSCSGPEPCSHPCLFLSPISHLRFTANGWDTPTSLLSISSHLQGYALSWATVLSPLDCSSSLCNWSSCFISCPIPPVLHITARVVFRLNSQMMSPVSLQLLRGCPSYSGQNPNHLPWSTKAFVSPTLPASLGSPFSLSPALPVASLFLLF